MEEIKKRLEGTAETDLIIIEFLPDLKLYLVLALVIEAAVQ
jgi:hypothetical protein